jgi:hypothetical protein
MLRQRPAAAVALALALVLSVVAVEPASAHQDTRNWRNCSYQYLARNIIVGYDPAFAFPAAGTGDGVTNSFTDRIYDAVHKGGRWSDQIKATGMVIENGAPAGMWYNGGSPVDVKIQYVDLTSGAAGTTSYAASCTIHGTPNSVHIGATTIKIDYSNYWFTQDDTRRSYWEGCPGRGDTTSYTCAKNYDFGSVITHELGHATGMADVHLIDGHLGNNGATTAAACSNPAAQATMCNNVGTYASAQRTPDTYDINSLKRHYGATS